MYSEVSCEIGDSEIMEISLLPLEPILDDDACCWHSLFANSVIARGFPIPPRSEQIGLEIEFSIMANLAAILYPLQCFKGIVLKGLSTILIPKQRQGDSVQWHLVHGAPEKKISMAEVAPDLQQFYETQDLQQLTASRAFLGLYRIAEVHLGTKESGYRNLNHSHASRERSRIELRETSASVGGSVSGMWNFMIGMKFSKQKGLRVVEDQSRILLERRLKNSQSQPVLMYDVGDHRGWLVPEINALLHITQACIARDNDLEPLLDSMPHAQASVDGAAAFSAIHDGKKFEIRKADQSFTDQPQYFIDFIKQILVGFERRKEVVLTRDNRSNMPITTPFGGPTLYGWEVEDLITGSMFYDRKEIKLNKTAGDWFRITKERADLLVLFCKGLGEPIKPCPETSHCKVWNPIPIHRGYLVATVQCLQQLSKEYDSNGPKTTCSTQLAPSIYWHRPLESKLFEACNSGAIRGCNRIQEVKDNKRANDPGLLASNGAVIFGKATSASQVSCIASGDTIARIQSATQSIPLPIQKTSGRTPGRV